MKKKALIIILVSFTLIIAILTISNISFVKTRIVNKVDEQTIQRFNKNEKNSDSSNKRAYEIIKASYNNEGIIINYPQIINLDNNNKQQKANQILKSDALKVLGLYENIDNDVSLEIDFGIKWKSEKILSIQYFGLGYVKGGAYPNNLFYTTNININNGCRLQLKDLVKINENFIEKFMEGKYKASNPNLSLKLEAAFDYIMENFTVVDLIKFFNEADLLFENSSYIYSYLTKDFLGISIGVPHAIGDHAEFEIKYKDIADNIKLENEVWKDFSI